MKKRVVGSKKSMRVNKHLTWLIPGRNIIKPMIARKAACQKLETLFPLMSNQRRGNRLHIGSLATMTLHFAIKRAETKTKDSYPVQYT